MGACQPGGPPGAAVGNGAHPAAASREVRALLAWMSDTEARLLLAGQTAEAVTAQQEALLASARRTLQSRPPGIDQDGLVRPAPAGLRGYLAELESSPHAQPYYDEGCVPALVDLPRVCAYQFKIYTEHSATRVAGAAAGDVRSLAAVTLPLGTPAALIPHYDRQRKAFITNLANPNLRVVGAFSAPAGDAPPGTVNLGFQVRLVASFVKVASMRGRYFLLDGYHRCLGLVRMGVRYAPAFVREDVPLDALARPGMLPFEVFMGDRPPVLPDYWDDGVSCSVRLPATRRAIIVPATEISVTG
jgi:hypothetical protein